MIIGTSLDDLCRVVNVRNKHDHMDHVVSHVHNPANIIEADNYDHGGHKCCTGAGQLCALNLCIACPLSVHPSTAIPIWAL